MKVTICDMCRQVVDNPHKAKIIKFTEVYECDYGMCFPKPHKEKLNIDICGDCLNKLRGIKQSESEVI